MIDTVPAWFAIAAPIALWGTWIVLKIRDAHRIHG